jgi:hypothetical protein
MISMHICKSTAQTISNNNVWSAAMICCRPVSHPKASERFPTHLLRMFPEEEI